MPKVGLLVLGRAGAGGESKTVPPEVPVPACPWDRSGEDSRTIPVGSPRSRLSHLVRDALVWTRTIVRKPCCPAHQPAHRPYRPSSEADCCPGGTGRRIRIPASVLAATIAGGELGETAAQASPHLAPGQPDRLAYGLGTTARRADSPASALITVAPANTTADPAVPTARPAASSGSISSGRLWRWREVMNNE